MDPELLLSYLCFHDQNIPEVDDCSAAGARTPIPAASIGANIAGLTTASPSTFKKRVDLYPP